MKVKLTYDVDNYIASEKQIHTIKVDMDPQASFYNNIVKTLKRVNHEGLGILSSSSLFFDQTFLEWEATPEGRNVVSRALSFRVPPYPRFLGNGNII